MESDSKLATINDDEVPIKSLDHSVHQPALGRPAILSSIINTRINISCNDIDNICMSQSPLDIQPRLFHPGLLFDLNTYERVLSSIYEPKNSNIKDEQDEEERDDDDDDDDDNNNNNASNNELFDEKALINEREQELQHLNQIILANRPMDDELANSIIEQLNYVLETTKMNNTNEQPGRDLSPASLSSSSVIMVSYPYPVINQSGPIADHDRPYADFGHLDTKTIAQECHFNLECTNPKDSTFSRGPIRMAAKSWAITAWTHVSKETVLTEIKHKFGIERLQYACVAQEISEKTGEPHLHIQIILKDKMNKKTWFLDSITETHCNYQVTMNDRAWNEYIKKGLNFIEFGNFKSTTKRARKEWPTQLSSFNSPSSSSSSSFQTQSTTAITTHRQTTTTNTSVRLQTEVRHRYDKEIAKQALKLAETSIHDAMDLIRHSMSDKFLAHSSWYLSTFNYIHLRAQHVAGRQGNIDKEYVWPIAFPECTLKLRETIDRWIRHHFSRTKRAKCLILIGPSGIGKTSFALSLPGHANYFKERWNLDKWSDYARYSVYDDIPWDDFAKLNYPNKKGLLTQNGKINATDKYRGTTEINVRQPAIVLLNPEDAGSLIAEPTTINEQSTASYWKKRAYVYIMDTDEYFYRRNKLTSNGDGIQVSSNSSMATDEERLGDVNEFEQTRLCWEEKQKQK